MNKGITAAGIEKMIPSANTPTNPTNPYAREKIKGVMIALIWKVAVLDVTACIRCDSGTTLAVMADLAGPPRVLVMPSIPTIENIWTGLKLSVINKIVAMLIKIKLNDCVTAINRFLSIQSATYNTFYSQRHLLKRSMYKELRSASFEAWSHATSAD